jgi:hypothetical protein
VARIRRRGRPQATRAIARNAAATGLASAAAAPAIAHQTSRPRASARTASSAKARPSAKVSRPVTSETSVAVANHSDAGRVPPRSSSPTNRSNAHALSTAAAAPTICGVVSAASGGNRIEYAGL